MSRLSLGLPSTVHIGSNEMVSYRFGWSSCRVKLANVRSARSHMTYWAWWLTIHCRRIERGNARCPHFSLAIISVTVQLWI